MAELVSTVGCIPTKTLLVAAEKDLSFERSHCLKIPSLVASMVKTMQLFAGTGVNILMRRSALPFKQGHRNPKLVMKNRTAAEIMVCNHRCCFRSVLQSLDLLQAKTSLTQQVSKLGQIAPEKLEFLVAEISGLEFAGLYNKLGSKVTSP